jgi:hypothetical protein
MSDLSNGTYAFVVAAGLVAGCAFALIRGWLGKKAGTELGNSMYLAGRRLAVIGFGLAVAFALLAMILRLRGG